MISQFAKALIPSKVSGLFVVCEINITIVIFIVNRKANKIYLKLYKIIVVRIFMF